MTQESPALNEKDCAVLEVFFEETERRWLNATQIARLSCGGVTPKSAADIGIRLSELGFLERKLEKWGKRTRSVFAVPPDSPDAFIGVVEAYFASLESRARQRGAAIRGVLFLGSPYARRNITEEFVREQLIRRRVEMRRMIVFDKKGELTTTKQAEYDSIAVRLPITGPSKSRAAAEDCAMGADRRQGQFYTDVLSAGVKIHYDLHERTRLILPLLSLCQISQGALREFIGPWERNADPTDQSMSFNEAGLEMVAPVLFRMTYAAVADLAASMTTPPAIDVTWASVCPERVPVRQLNPPALLEIQWREEGLIGIWAGFTAQAPFDYLRVETWWSDGAINGPSTPAHRTRTKRLIDD